MLDVINLLDRNLFRFFNLELGQPWLDPIMLFFSSEKVLAGVVLLWLLYSLITKNFRALKKYLPLLGLTLILTDSLSFRVLKPGFGRLRPCYQFSDVRLVAERCGSDHGFPSNHAANSFGFAAMLFLLSRNKRRVLWFVFAIVVSLSRIYLGVHFPGDVFLGALVGVSIALGIYFCRELLRRAMEPGRKRDELPSQS